MLSLLRQKIFPIGVDQGSYSLKMIQLTRTGNGLGLVAAAQAEVPHELHSVPAALQEWSVETIRELLSSKPFKGKKVVSCLPAREVLIQHLRVPKMDDEQLEKALLFEAQGKVPFNINQGRLCHVVAGEVYEGSVSKLEVILMAASASTVARNLNMVERTKIDIESINVEPCALVSCFGHLLDDAQAQEYGTMFIDLGHSCSKVVITHARNIVFCRTIGIAGEQLTRAISDKLSVNYGAARMLLFNLGQDSPLQKEKTTNNKSEKPGAQRNTSLFTLDAQTSSAVATLTETAPSSDPSTAALEAVGPTLQNLCDELRSCARYHNMLFNGQALKRVIFLGGLAKNTNLCQRLARGLGLPAQLADPLARIDATTLTGVHSDLAAGQRYREWAVALGLSLSGKETS